MKKRIRNIYFKKYMKNYCYKRSQFLKKLLGDKCSTCNSNENLQFDHIDHRTKSFTISKSLSRSLSALLKEITKCQLLCKKCHDIKSKNEGSFLKNKLGSKNPASKLTEEQVKKIKELLLLGYSHSEIGYKYKVSKDTIYSINKKHTWSHVSN